MAESIGAEDKSTGIWPDRRRIENCCGRWEVINICGGRYDCVMCWGVSRIPDDDFRLGVLAIGISDFDLHDENISAQLPFGGFGKITELPLAGVPQPISSAPQGKGKKRDNDGGGGGHKVVPRVDPFCRIFDSRGCETIGKAAAFFGTLLSFFLLFVLTRRKR